MIQLRSEKIVSICLSFTKDGTENQLLLEWIVKSKLTIDRPNTILRFHQVRDIDFPQIVP